ncbi:MAG: hypothetical protein C5B52_10270 [Bacteroidetes bacterium]|nr:MAG: hypothetical protein C5B52_10270 [Bacteroidota bacterium]
MKNSREIDQKVQAAFESLDSMGKADPGPYFATRLMARMKNRDSGSWDKLISFVTRPAFILASLVIILFVNMVAAFHETKKPNFSESVMQSYSDDYRMNTTSLYDYETPEP